MANKLKLSTEHSRQLEFLSGRLGLRRNIICRLAIGRSLIEPASVSKYKPKDSSGTEFNRYTLTGDLDDIYKALIIQHEKKRMDDEEFFVKYLRNHIERGIGILYEEYQKINSPIDFIVGLVEVNSFS
ncbi:MAG: DNA sulfur modification protein DndE [Thermotogaceae bacterium]|nr:DNA sulfur modification protein DndE [Thermotogaceae bacterium]